MLTSTIPDLISLYGYNNELIEITDEETGVTTITESKVPIGVATEERSGTEIMIPLINERDWMSFKTSIEKELCYFDDVYTVNLNVENAYTIYRKDTFLYRNTGRYSNELHIVLGKCCYPIDWKSIDREVVELPFGIIFNIGELQVVPNRESIVYDIGEDDTIKNIINAKIDAVLKEVNELLTKGDSFKETDDLVHYLANRNKKPAIWFEGNPVYIPVKYIKNKGAVLQFTPLKHLPITIPDNPFFYYEIVGEIEGESYTRVDSNYGTYSVNYGNKYISLDTPANMYTNAFISNHRYERKVAKKNNIKLNYSRILTQLSLYKYYSKKQLQYRIENNDPHYDYREIDKKLIRQELVLSKHRIVKEYIEVMDRYFEKYLIKYSDLAPDEE